MKKIFLLLFTISSIWANEDFYKFIDELQKKTEPSNQKQTKQVSSKININQLYTLNGVFIFNNTTYALIDKKKDAKNSVKRYKLHDKLDQYEIIKINKKVKSVILKNRFNHTKHILYLSKEL